MARRAGAAIDLGSTSVHLLIARPAGSELIVIDDESSFLGLGAAADGPGFLGPEARRTLVATVAGYVERARAAGALQPVVMGTEPLRRLADAGAIADEIADSCGVPLHVLQHEEEARLTLIGLTAGRTVRRDLIVVDIGGGSTEVVEIGPNRPARAAGIPVGAGRLTRSLVSHDPPLATEIASLTAAAGAAFTWSPSRPPDDVVAVGGTASNLLKLVRRSAGTDVADDLDRAALDTVRRIVSGARAESLAVQFGMREARIRLLAAGAAIIEAVLARTGVEALRVADSGIREGAIIAVDRAGTGWRERLEELAHGWIG